MTEYQEEIESFDLEPGSGGEFEFSIDGDLAYSKKETGQYPELAELKRAVVAAMESRS